MWPLLFLSIVFACRLFSSAFEIHCPHPKYQQVGCIEQNAPLVAERKQIVIPGFSGAYNPTIVKNGDGYTLFFRYDEPNQHKLFKEKFQFMTYIGYVDLDVDWKVISVPKILKMKSPYCEDPRVVAFQDKWILFFNEIYPQTPNKRGMKVAIINPKTKAVEKIYPLPGGKGPVEKNWTPFVRHTEEGEELYYVYDFNTLSIFQVFLTADGLKTESVYEGGEKWAALEEWKGQFGALRGGAPLIYVDGEYWAFFHSMFNEVAEDRIGKYKKYYYHPGLLSFNFEEKKMTGFLQYPLLYNRAFQAEKARCFNKWIVYPSGALYDPVEKTVLISIAENDSAIFLVKYSKELLKNALQNRF
ncbi:MAG: hypothetical protein ACOYK9_04405 [Chlamydiia bacterium]